MFASIRYLVQGVRRRVDPLLLRYYFYPEMAQSLSLFRFFYCATIFWVILSRRAGYLRKFEGTIYYPTPLFEMLDIPLMSVEVFQTLQYVLLAALALTALGVFTRVSATVAWIAFFFYMGTYLGFGKSPHTPYVIHSQNIVFFVLLILSVSPGVAVYGFDGWRLRNWRWRVSSIPETAGDTPTVSAWPRQLIMLTLGLAYFGAGYCKLATHPLWADGYTLQGHLFTKYLLIDSSLGFRLAQSYWLCLLLGIGTLVLEMSFFIVVYYPRLRWVYLPSAIAFHGLIYLTMDINFFPYFGSTLLVFLGWPAILRLTALLRGLVRWVGAFKIADGPPPSSVSLIRPSHVEPSTFGDSPRARWFVLGMAMVLFVCVIGRVEAWPFTDYRVFAERHHPEIVRVYRLAAVDIEGNTHLASRGWVPQSPTEINSRVIAHLLNRDPAAVATLLVNMGRHLATKDTTGAYRAVMFVERALREDTQSAGGQAWQVIDRPVFKWTLPARGSSPPLPPQGSTEDSG